MSGAGALAVVSGDAFWEQGAWLRNSSPFADAFFSPREGTGLSDMDEAHGGRTRFLSETRRPFRTLPQKGGWQEQGKTRTGALFGTFDGVRRGRAGMQGLIRRRSRMVCRPVRLCRECRTGRRASPERRGNGGENRAPWRGCVRWRRRPGRRQRRPRLRGRG